jgi:hypothetical protein
MSGEKLIGYWLVDFSATVWYIPSISFPSFFPEDLKLFKRNYCCLFLGGYMRTIKNTLLMFLALHIHSIAISANQKALSSSNGPQVLYTYAQYISPTSAKFTSGIRSNGFAMRVFFFAFWSDGAFNSSRINTTPELFPPDTGTVEVEQIITGLSSDSSYSYWVVVESSVDTPWGAFQNDNSHNPVTTAKISTLPPVNITQRTATVRALCNTHGYTTAISFSWSTVNLDGGTTTPIVVNSDVDTIVTATIENLTPAALYYIQAMGNNVSDILVRNSGEHVPLLMLPDSNARGMATQINLVTSNKLAWTALNFGVHTYATYCIDPPLGELALPPTAPGIDIRLVGIHSSANDCLNQSLGTYTDLRQYLSPSQVDTYKVKILADPSYYPMTLSWPNLDSAYNGTVLLSTFEETIDMKTQTSYQLVNSDVSAVKIIAASPRPQAHAPTVLVKRPMYLESGGVNLSAAVNPNGRQTKAWFEWGANFEYSGAVCDITPDSGVASINLNLLGPFPTPISHYRVITQNALGTYVGFDALFTPPSVLSGPDPVHPLPGEFTLLQNYPNPFNPSTSISFTIPKQSHVRLQVFNVLGQLVGTLVDGSKQAGSYTVTWDASSKPDGVYFYKLSAGAFVQTKKMVLMK